MVDCILPEVLVQALFVVGEISLLVEIGCVVAGVVDQNVLVEILAEDVGLVGILVEPTGECLVSLEVLTQLR